MKKLVVIIFIIISFGFGTFKASSYQLTLTEIGELDTGWSTVDVYVKDDILYALDSDLGLKIYNISDPTTPKELGSYRDSYTYSHAFCYVNGLILIADYKDKLEIVNVSDPTTPQIIGRYQERNSSIQWSSSTDLAVVDNHAFLASQDEGVEIIDISDPTQPVKIGSYYDGQSINVVSAINGLAFIGESYGHGQGGGFAVLDTTDLNSPMEIHQSSGINVGIELFVLDNFLYVPDEDFGLRIYDIDDPSNVVKVGEKLTDGECLNCVVENRGTNIYAYVTAQEAGLIILDVTDPENIEEIGRYNDGGQSFSLFVQNDLVFVAEFSDGLEILQISVDNETSNSSTPSFEFLFIFGGLVSLIVMIRRKEKM